jgi:hypothetical protein
MRHDFQIAHDSGAIRGSLVPILAITLFCIFVVIAIFNTFVTTKDYEFEIIERDITKLVDAFHQIEKDCKIYTVEGALNSINFLNVKSFVGSQIGPINLKHPDRWQGPYMDRNPSIQGIEYLLVRTKKGYFVTPGQGVKLPNGKVVGKDIKLDEESDIEAMMKDEKQFRYRGKSLAAPIKIKKRGPFYVPGTPLNYSL